MERGTSNKLHKWPHPHQHMEGCATSLASPRHNHFKTQNTSVGKDTEKLHPSYTAAGTGAAAMENSLAVPQVKPRAHTTPQFHSSKRRESTTTHRPVQDYRRSSEGRKPTSIS